MIEFEIEWIDAPGVSDSVLADTWARLELRINGREVIQFFDKTSRTLRHGIYGSVFPLASWLVENWWNILYEPPISPQIFEGARSAGLGERKQRLFVNWMRRHNFLFAREGMALPDMSIFRDEDCIFVRWLADTEAEERGPFIGEGSERLEPKVVEKGLRDFVSCVLQRLADTHATNEVAELKANWLAICDSQENEPELCQALAALGEDPYDPEGVDEELISVLQNRVMALNPTLRHDLLGWTSPSTLDNDCQCVENLSASLDRFTGHNLAPWRIPVDLPMSKTPWAYQDGYRRAEHLRNMLGIDRLAPIFDLTTLITREFGEFIEEHVVCPPTKRIEGLVACDRTGNRVLLTPATKKLSSSKRFLEARALHQWIFTINDRASMRLLTGSHEWEQRASRAFAAELLAPAAAIQQKLDELDDPDAEYMRPLAEHFDVSEYVILYQIENHRLSTPS